MKKILVVVTLSVPMALPLLGNAQDNYPRTPSGKPDFTGHYDISTLTPFERPRDYGDRLFLNEEEVQSLRDREMGIREQDAIASDPDREAPEEGGNIGSYNDFWFDRGNDGFIIDGQYRTSILTYPENGRMPARTPAGQAKADAAPKFAWPERDGAWWLETGDQPYDGPENQTLAVRCIYHQPATIPITPRVYNNLKTIVQTDDYLMLYIEWMHWARIIRIGDEHNSEVLATFDGDSIGWWEGDTLVVETTNFMDQPYQPSDGKKIVERFSPEPGGGLIYSFDVEDVDYTDRYAGEMVWPRSDQVPYEYACHEGNYAMSATLMGASVREREHREQNGSEE
ncbi:MAG: hypothetical protein OXU30_15555 [Gammaproteobacteria bacterium]|nr:hypothetical protein [Gammaproteobacteria bacterium]